MKKILHLALLLAVLTASALACNTGFQQVTDPFLLPNGSPWAGSITYTLIYNTTVAGASVVGSKVQFNVTNGFSACLAPGLYAPVVLFQNGNSYRTTTQWSVGSNGPYTYAQITSSGTLTSSPVLSNTVTIANAAVLALAATPVTLVPAVSGWVVWPSRIAVAVANNCYRSDDQILAVGFGSIASFTGIGSFGWINGNEEADYLDSIYFPGVINGPAANYSGLPLIGYATNAVTNPDCTGGNVTFTIFYVLVPGSAQ